MSIIIDEARKALQIEADAILSLIPKLDSSFEKAVNLLLDCSGRIIVTGMGKSGLIGKKIAATFSSIGMPSYFLHPAEAIHGDLGMITSHDIVLAISNSGETEEVVRLLPHIKHFKVKLISLCRNSCSTLSSASDAFMDISVEKEACPLGIVPTASTTVTLAIGDALACAVISRRNFRAEDFACFHPGGVLGKRILTKVKDVMRTGERVPCVYDSVPVFDVVMEITSKHLGMSVVTAGNNSLVGIITDGDLRRGLADYGKDYLDKKVSTVMTQNPKTIAADELAAEALSVMETYSITSLPVVNASNEVEGIIHIHDILREGII